MYITPQRMNTVIVESVADTAVSIPINGRSFVISNPGAQPLYINPETTATANDFLIPAGTSLPIVFSCLGNLSVISNATGTTVSILITDI